MFLCYSFTFEKQIFYLGPKQDCPKPGNLWHDAMAVGKEKLLTMVRDMCADAGIVEKKTNHSLE